MPTTYKQMQIESAMRDLKEAVENKAGFWQCAELEQTAIIVGASRIKINEIMRPAGQITPEILEKVKTWARQNAAAYVIDLLEDETILDRGLLQGRRVCDCAAENHARALELI